jgi:hypothetical protein
VQVPLSRIFPINICCLPKTYGRLFDTKSVGKYETYLSDNQKCKAKRIIVVELQAAILFLQIRAL